MRRRLRGAAHLVLDLHRHGQSAGLVGVELRPDDLADLRAAAHTGVRHEDAALRADVDKGAIPAHVDDAQSGNLAFLHLRHAHAGRQAALRVQVEEDIDKIADGDRMRLLRLMQQDVIRGIPRLGVEEGAHLTDARDLQAGDRARAELPLGARSLLGHFRLIVHNFHPSYRGSLSQSVQSL